MKTKNDQGFKRQSPTASPDLSKPSYATFAPEWSTSLTVSTVMAALNSLIAILVIFFLGISGNESVDFFSAMLLMLTCIPYLLFFMIGLTAAGNELLKPEERGRPGTATGLAFLHIVLFSPVLYPFISLLSS